ncbi:MAG: maleylpyruvate isomerase family mycothiol-dependent enzyme [Corynebacterium sp.]|nr:maleylpyruvate isomerase family mycothiol-dependent enzyme [Corynebacterium sp.]
MHDYRDELFQAQQWIAELLRETQPGDYDKPTPCVDFTVRDLVTHLFFVGEVMEALPITGENPFADAFEHPEKFPLLHQELAQKYLVRKTAEDQSVAWLRLADSSRQHWRGASFNNEFRMPWGVTLTGAETVGLYVVEVVCHGYDLAAGIGATVEGPTAAAEAALVAAQVLIPAGERGMEHGVPFEPSTEASAGSGPTVQLAAFLGRKTTDFQYS